MYKNYLMALCATVGLVQSAQCSRALPEAPAKRNAKVEVVHSNRLEEYLQTRASEYSAELEKVALNTLDTQAKYDVVQRIRRLAKEIRLMNRQGQVYKKEIIEQMIYSSLLEYIQESAYHFARTEGATDAQAKTYRDSMVNNAIAGGHVTHKKLYTYVGARLSDKARAHFKSQTAAQGQTPEACAPTAPPMNQGYYDDAPPAYDSGFPHRGR